MLSLKATIRLIATMILLSMGFVLNPQGSANAAMYCAELEGQQPQDTPTVHFHRLKRVGRM